MCCARPSGCSHQAAGRLWAVWGLSETGDLCEQGYSRTPAPVSHSLDEQHSIRYGIRHQLSS